MSRLRTFVIGAFSGCVVVYFLDPNRGRTRRSELVQGAVRISQRAQRTVARRTSIAAGRARGLVQRAKHRDVADRHPSDEKLLDRVRSELFRSPEIPKGQVNVNVEHGTVFLRGHVDSQAMRTRIEAASRAVQGVIDVENLINVES